MVKNLQLNSHNNNVNNDQVKRINELFGKLRRPSSSHDSEYVEVEISKKDCNIHRGSSSIVYTNLPPSLQHRRGSAGSSYTTASSNDYSINFNSLPRRNRRSVDSPTNGNDESSTTTAYDYTKRRHSEGYHLGQSRGYSPSLSSHSATDKIRTPNSYTDLLLKRNIEHPSAFPTLLREDSQEYEPPRQKESLASQVAAEVIAAAAAKIDHNQPIYHPPNLERRRSSINSVNSASSGERKSIEHPSAFPTLLRSSDGQSYQMPRQKESLASQLAAEVIAAAAAKIDHSQPIHYKLERRRPSAETVERKSIEHPSAFPTMLRNSDSHQLPRQKESLASQLAAEAIATASARIEHSPSPQSDRRRSSTNLSNADKKNIEHPNAFPSLLRSNDGQSYQVPRQRESLASQVAAEAIAAAKAKIDSVRSSTPLYRRTNGTNIRNTPDRNSFDFSSRLESRNSIDRVLPSMRNSVDRKPSYTTGRKSVERTVFRRDSGRDSVDRVINSTIANLGKRNSVDRQSVPRDYVAPSGKLNLNTKRTNPNSFILTPKQSPSPPHQSILRKSSSPSHHIDLSDNSNSDTKSSLTKENVTRHVRILEDENILKQNRQRRQSERSDTFDDYRNNYGQRRISVDSLDIKRNSLDLSDAPDDILRKFSIPVNTQQQVMHCDPSGMVAPLPPRDYYNLPKNGRNTSNNIRSTSNVPHYRNDTNNNNFINKCNFEIQCQNGLRKLSSNNNLNNINSNKKAIGHNNYNSSNKMISSNSVMSTNSIKNKNKKNSLISRSVDDLRLEDNLLNGYDKYKGYYNSSSGGGGGSGSGNKIIMTRSGTQTQNTIKKLQYQQQQQQQQQQQHHTTTTNIINQQQASQHLHHNYPKQKSSLYNQINKNKHYSMDNLLTAVDTHFGITATSYQNDVDRPQFVAVTSLDESQAVRCAEFHPNGKLYAVGSNSKVLRICEYPSLADIREDHTTYQPTIICERAKYHKGSIYCLDWSPDGELIATGSNDKTIKLMRYNPLKNELEGHEIELTMHDGTIRDLCFIEDSTNKASLLISGGAGDNKIYVTDCATATPFQALSGHGGHILSLYNWGGAMFVSGSQDKTIRFWDLRTRQCVNTITPATTAGSRQGSPVAAVSVDPSGRLLVSGHEDSSVVLYDIRGNRPIQCFKPHTADIRSIRFSPSAYYLLTAGYDKKLVLTDLQGDLTLPLPSVVVAHHSDKVISGRWHPTDFSFLSTSADKTAVLWALSSKP